MDVLYALQPKYVRIYSRIRVQVLPSTTYSMVAVAQITVTASWKQQQGIRI